MKQLCAAALAAVCASVGAQPSDVETTVVTGIRLASDPARLADAVLVIDETEIHNSAAASLADLLRGRAGIEINDFYGDGSRVNVGLRGFGDNAASNTLVLVDGRALNNPDIGSADLGRLDLDEIARIEILQGGNAFYGDQAVGGVINIVTRPAAAEGAGVSIELGSFDRRAARAKAAIGAGPVAVQLRTHTLGSDNYRQHNRLERDGASLRLGAAGGSLSWRLDANYTDESLQTPGALLSSEAAQDRRQSAEDFSDDFSDAKTRDVATSADWSMAPGWRLAAQLGRRDSDGRFRLSFRGFRTEPATQNRIVDSLDLRVVRTLTIDGRPGSVMLGTDLRRAHYRLESQFGLQRNKQDIDAVYVGALLPLAAKAEATAALRHSRATDRLRDSGDFASLPQGKRLEHDRTTASLGLAWRPSAELKIFAGWDQVLRYAKVDEYFGSGSTPDTIDLEPQTGNAFELGAQFRAGPVAATVTAFALELDDEIVFDPAANDFGANVNLDRSRRRGLLVDGRWALSSALTLDMAWTWIDAELRSGSRRGKDIPLVAEHLGRAALSWQATRQWRLRAEFNGNSSRTLGGDFDNSLAPLPGFGIVNLVANWSTGRLDVSARLNNLLDREYAEQGNEAAPPPDFDSQPSLYPMPDLNATLKIEYRI